MIIIRIKNKAFANTAYDHNNRIRADKGVFSLIWKDPVLLYRGAHRGRHEVRTRLGDPRGCQKTAGQEGDYRRVSELAEVQERAIIIKEYRYIGGCEKMR